MFRALKKLSSRPLSDAPTKTNLPLNAVMGVPVTLIVTSCIFAILVMIGAVYFVVYFQHPNDKWVAWFPKSVVV
jgi:uncharacterized membrane protein